MKKRLLPLLILIALYAGPALAQQSLRIGASAPQFTGTQLNGGPIDLASLKGRVVVMTFWSTRCAICHHELPKLNALARKYERSAVTFLALSMENEDKINGYLARNEFRFRIVPNSFGTVLQYADRDRSGNLDMGFPAYFVIDPQGTIRHRGSGYDKTAPMDAAIAKLLQP